LCFSSKVGVAVCIDGEDSPHNIQSKKKKVIWKGEKADYWQLVGLPLYVGDGPDKSQMTVQTILLHQRKQLVLNSA
jgi:hypothetical protein